MPEILILADDLTGAADTGVQFAASGSPALLQLAPNRYTPSATVVVLDSESRSLPAGTCSLAIRSMLDKVTLADFRIIFKKIDSTLRGNPGEELGVLMQMTGEQRVLVAPAFPAQGRVTRNGTVWIDDKPLGQTSFAAEAGNENLTQIFHQNPIRISLELVRLGAESVSAVLRQASGTFLADAETDEDLSILAQAALSAGIRVFCGSAGLAKAIPKITPGSRLNFADPVNDSKLAGPEGKTPVLLAVAGSVNASTVAQVAYAQRHGIDILTPPLNFFQEHGQDGVHETAQRLSAYCQQRKQVILTTIPDEKARGFISPNEIAKKLAQAAIRSVPSHIPVGMFLTGGETALAVCQALELSHLWLRGEVETGMPWSSSGRCTLVTKAGGFGKEDAIFNGLLFLKKQTQG